MTNQNKEHLSAALDNELTTGASEVLARIPESEELTKTWDSFHLIGDVIRGEGLRVSAEGISARVSEQLEMEPAIVAAPKMIPAHRRSERWFKPMASAAIAASVATVAVLTYNAFTDSGVSGGPAQQIATLPMPVSGDTQSGTRWKNLAESKVESKLNRFLVNHSEYAASAGLGVMPYTTFVGYDGSGKRP